jgi:hypothetical protein
MPETTADTALPVEVWFQRFIASTPDRARRLAGLTYLPCLPHGDAVAWKSLLAEVRAAGLLIEPEDEPWGSRGDGNMFDSYGPRHGPTEDS